MWFSPTGHIGVSWIDEGSSYDDDLVSYADYEVEPYTWTGWLIPTIDPIICDKVRFYASLIPSGTSQIRVEVWYDEAYHLVYEGTYTHNAWVEKAIPEGARLVSRVRLKIYNDNAATKYGAVYEVDFGVSPKAPGYGNCVALWGMNDNAATKAVVDDSGKGNDGEAQQNTDQLTTAGKIKTALTFNGASDYMYADLLSALTKDGTYSFSVWVKTNVADWQVVFQNAPAASDRNSMGIINFNVRFGYYNGVAWSGVSRSLTQNEWTHLVGINNGGSLSLYVNGRRGTGAHSPYCSSQPTSIFIGKKSYGDDYYFNGIMDAIIVFDKALSIEEIAWLWNWGNGRENLGIARLLVGSSLADGRKGLV